MLHYDDPAAGCAALPVPARAVPWQRAPEVSLRGALPCPWREGDDERLPRADRFADQPFGLVRFGESPGLDLREDKVVTDLDLEDPTTAREQRHAARQVVLIIVKDVLRQTGGSFQISSGRAVGDRDARRATRVAHGPVLSPAPNRAEIATGTDYPAARSHGARPLPPRMGAALPPVGLGRQSPPGPARLTVRRPAPATRTPAGRSSCRGSTPRSSAPSS